MRKISLFQFCLIASMTIINLVFFVLSLVKGGIKILVFLTTWSYWVNTTYLTIVFLCDCNLFLRKNDQMEKLSEYFRNAFSKMGGSMTYTVTILYWLLVILGPSFMSFSTSDGLTLFFHIYHHGIITVFVVIELIVFDHKGIKWKNIDVLILSFIYFAYLIVCLIAIYALDMKPYEFISYLKPYQLLSPVIVFYIILINSYQLHIWLINTKNTLLNKEPEAPSIDQVSEGLLISDKLSTN